MPTFLEMKLKKHRAIESAFKDLDNVDQSLKDISAMLANIKEELAAAYYAKAVLTKGYGVGDVVVKDGMKVKVTQYINGMFWGIEIGNNRQRKPYPLYEGWEIL